MNYFTYHVRPTYVTKINIYKKYNFATFLI